MRHCHIQLHLSNRMLLIRLTSEHVRPWWLLNSCMKELIWVQELKVWLPICVRTLHVSVRLLKTKLLNLLQNALVLSILSMVVRWKIAQRRKMPTRLFVLQMFSKHQKALPSIWIRISSSYIPLFGIVLWLVKWQLLYLIRWRWPCLKTESFSQQMVAKSSLTVIWPFTTTLIKIKCFLIWLKVIRLRRLWQRLNNTLRNHLHAILKRHWLRRWKKMVLVVRQLMHRHLMLFNVVTMLN